MMACEAAIIPPRRADTLQPGSFDKHDRARPANPRPKRECFGKPRRWKRCPAPNGRSLCDGCAARCLPGKARRRGYRQDLFHPTCRADCWMPGCAPARIMRNRSDKVPDCVRLTPENVRHPELACRRAAATKLVAEGRDLYWWHPLISGDPNTVHEGRRLRGAGGFRERRTRLPTRISRITIVQWPALLPKRARLKKRPV